MKWATARVRIATDRNITMYNNNNVRTFCYCNYLCRHSVRSDLRVYLESVKPDFKKFSVTKQSQGLY
jgi:hypothetical protein